MGASHVCMRTDGHSKVLPGWNDTADRVMAVKYWNCATQNRRKMIVKEAEL